MFRKYFIVAISAIVGLCFAIGGSFFSQVNAQTPRVPAVPAQQANAVDLAFVNEAAQFGEANIMLGQLALQRSQNQSVRQFAQAEVAEQQNNKQQLTRIAPQLRVTLPTVPGPKYQALMQRFRQLSGTQFDNAYLDEGVNAHLEAASLFQREAAFGRNPSLISLVNQGLPIINRHFTIASQLTNYRFAQVPRRYNEAAVPSTTPRAQ
ncbi:DUF4142 domain-containing protein [Leptolyngbya sp. NIES-2104]|uniref:DUF4142 domain-containing protein n=1 Tax=Leptolyngbya sp. NIES-2104 TaxID=1552121 RepID=UPI0006EC7DA5|nr:DUF4142 domain-containing protein [Leptolyngbya sp. NIES-2104]GAP93766.1 putative exported protein [Leptolyngbya sp. NIES-2104]